MKAGTQRSHLLRCLVRMKTCGAVSHPQHIIAFLPTLIPLPPMMSARSSTPPNVPDVFIWTDMFAIINHCYKSTLLPYVDTMKDESWKLKTFRMQCLCSRWDCMLFWWFRNGSVPYFTDCDRTLGVAEHLWLQNHPFYITDYPHRGRGGGWVDSS